MPGEINVAPSLEGEEDVHVGFEIEVDQLDLSGFGDEATEAETATEVGSAVDGSESSAAASKTKKGKLGPRLRAALDRIKAGLRPSSSRRGSPSKLASDGEVTERTKRLARESAGEESGTDAPGCKDDF
ncbi:hypothetical protein ACHAWF_015009 [Thalassiosira exigua]